MLKLFLFSILLLVFSRSQTTPLSTNQVEGLNNLIHYGEYNKIRGNDNQVAGHQNYIIGQGNSAQGTNNQLNGNKNIVNGIGNTVSGQANIVEGHGNLILGDDASQQEKALLSQKMMSIFASRGISGISSPSLSNNLQQKKEEKISKLQNSKQKIVPQTLFSPVKKSQNEYILADNNAEPFVQSVPKFDTKSSPYQVETFATKKQDPKPLPKPLPIEPTQSKIQSTLKQEMISTPQAKPQIRQQPKKPEIILTPILQQNKVEVKQVQAKTQQNSEASVKPKAEPVKQETGFKFYVNDGSNSDTSAKSSTQLTSRYSRNSRQVVDQVQEVEKEKPSVKATKSLNLRKEDVLSPEITGQSVENLDAGQVRGVVSGSQRYKRESNNGGFGGKSVILFGEGSQESSTDLKK